MEVAFLFSFGVKSLIVPCYNLGYGLACTDTIDNTKNAQS
jgi:hypothetical protein